MKPETEQALAELDWSKRDVLVGSLGSEAQLAHNLQHNYYHVPACYISDGDLPVRYVAVYQSLNFFGEAGGVHWYGEVERVERMERRAVPFPVNRNNASELYYVFRIRQWKRLSGPVSIREEWVSEPRFTNRFLLEHAAFTYELFSVRSEEDFRLTHRINRLLEEGTRSAAVKLREDRALLLERNAFSVVDPAGKVLDRIPLSDFRESPGSGLWRIKRARG